MAIPTLKIGSLTIAPLQRLPSSKFTSGIKKVQSTLRGAKGQLFINRQYSKYVVQISGLAQTLFDDLRYLYEQDGALDLYSLANRKEVLSPPGSTSVFFTSRRVRLDDTAVPPVVEYPEGTVLASSTYSIVNGVTNAMLTFGSVLPAGTASVIRYYPIISGYITDYPTADYIWERGEESWSIVFEEA